MNNTAFYIGRFQILNIAHLTNIKNGLRDFDTLIIFLGSSNVINDKNPFSALEREHMIRLCLTPDENERVKCIPIDDKETDEEWVSIIQDHLNTERDNATIIGTEKDESSYYVRIFPNKFIGYPIITTDNTLVSSTLARAYWRNHEWTLLSKIVPAPVLEYLKGK